MYNSFQNLLIYVLSSLLLSLCFSLSTFPQPVGLDKSNKTNTAVDSATMAEADYKNKLEEEKYNPTKDYKLIAIYLIGNEPRALIKNLTTPDQSPKEYRVGEFIDEIQTLSLSRIAFNPTARIELIDQEGFSYLIRTSSQDVKEVAGSPKLPSSIRSSPSYFSGSSPSKSKASKKKSDKTGESEDSATVAPEKANDINTNSDAARKASPDSSSTAQIKGVDQTIDSTQSQALIPPAQPTPQSSSTSQSIQAITTGSTSSQSTLPIQAGSSQSASPGTVSPAQQKQIHGDLQDRPSNPFQ